jgi:16S rRNA (uracil1498-N3)-methyltransferase
MSERFYVNLPLATGGAVELHGPEAHHLATVCRLRPGDAVCLFNGDGHEYPARVLTAERRRVTVEVLDRSSPSRELPFTLEVAAPLPKGDRAQLLAEKLTELGVTTFIPLKTQRSVAQPREARLEKLERHVIEASKQCGRVTLMQVRPLTAWAAWCAEAGPNVLRVLAHPTGPGLLGALRLAPGQALRAAVGPEGGFIEEEVEQGRAAGWHVVDLGPRILRVETAALVLAAWAVTASASHIRAAPCQAPL